MIEQLEKIDRSIFIALNGMNNEYMDSFMYLVSHKLFWVPFYLLLLFAIQRKYGWRRFGFFVLAIALTVTLSDQISSSFFKPFFARYRPCNNLDLIDIVHTVRGKCGSGFSFVSGHATNFFAIATLASLTLGVRKYSMILLLWAALIAFSRVYLGVHYPADIAVGGLLGVLIGYGVFKAFSFFVLQKIKA